MELKYKKIIKSVEKSGAIILSYFGKDYKTFKKSHPLDFYTEADIKSEKNLINTIQKEFPTHNIQSEERGFINKKSDYTFVIDPLDGTLNMHLGIANFSVTLALLKQNEAIFAVTHNPVTQKTYFAEKGKGSFLNGKKIKVNKVVNLRRMITAYTCNYKTPLSYLQNLDKKLSELKIRKLMTNWSPALDLCLLAEGKIEVMVNNDNALHDNLAGKLIIREARGKITDFKGKSLKSDRQNIFLATNGTKIHNQILKIL